MALLTVERNTPSPYESLDNDDVLSSSSYEGFVAKEHLAVSLSPKMSTSLSRNGVSLPIHTHLKRIIKLMRSCDSLKMAVELENNGIRNVRKYLIVIMYMDNEDSEETLILGTEQDDTVVKLCLVLPVWGDTQIKLDGDGGFSVHTGDQHRIFKPMSVQSMWTTLQTLYKSTEVARACNHYVGGLSHSWLSHYKALMTDDWNILNEWNAMEDVVSTRSGSPLFTVGSNDDKQSFEAQLVNRLREVMLGSDLEEISSKQLRLKLEEEMKMDLKEYREFLDQQMLRILGQLEKPSKICDYLYLGSEWNAANLEELKRLGVGYILNVTREIDNFFPEMFTYFNVRLYDLPDSELIKHWDKTYQFIKTAKEKGSKVLVHCKMGISRSAATVVAYKMKEYQLPLEEALASVKSNRSCINPNDGFIQQLKAYEGILRARHNELWGKHAPNRLLPHQRTMSEPNIRSMSPSMETDYPLSPHHEEQSSFTHQFMSTNDLQQEGNPLSSWSPTRENLMDSGPVDKTDGVIHYLGSLPPLSDDDEVYREHQECSKPDHSSPFLTPPQSRRSYRRREPPMHPLPGGHIGSGGVPTTSAKEGPAVASVKVGEGVVGVATNGCLSVVEEHVTAPGLTLAAMATPDSVPDPNVVSCVEKPPTMEGGLLDGVEGALVQTKQISSVPERVKEIEERARSLQVTSDKVAQRSSFGSTNSIDEGSRSASPHPVEEVPIPVSAGSSPNSKHTSVSRRQSSSSNGPLSPLQGNLPAFPGQSSVGVEPSENKEKVGDELVNCVQGGGVKAKILQMEELVKDAMPVLRRKDSIASADKVSVLDKKAGLDDTSTPAVEAKRPLSGGDERKKEDSPVVEREDEKKKEKDVREEERKKEKDVREEEKKKEKDVREEEKKKQKDVREEEKKKEKDVREEDKKKEKDVREEEKKKEKDVREEDKKKEKDVREEDKKKEKDVREEEKKKEKDVREEEKKKQKDVREEEKKKEKDVREEEKKKEKDVREEEKKKESERVIIEEKLVEKKEDDIKDNDTEVNGVLALRKLFGDPEPKKPETQQWQQLQLFAKVPAKPQEPARSVSPSLSTVKKDLQPPIASAQ